MRRGPEPSSVGSAWIADLLATTTTTTLATTSITCVIMYILTTFTTTDTITITSAKHQMVFAAPTIHARIAAGTILLHYDKQGVTTIV